jgi:hypothetical protein
MHPWAGSLVPAVADGLTSGFGVTVEETGGVEVFGGGEEVGLVAVPEDGGPDDGDPDGGGPDGGGPDGGGPDGGGPDGGADVLGWTGKRGASCRQAAMTTRLPPWSALPPTPLRSTK